MSRKDKPPKDERRAVKKTEKALSGNRFQCDACSLRFGTVDMLGIHKAVAHS